MHCESMKEEHIPIVVPMYKAKLGRNIDICKSTKHNKSLIKHNRSIIMLRGLSPNKIYAMKSIGSSFYDLEFLKRDRQFNKKYLTRNIHVRYLS